ncbi:hypothetical protein GQ44DRAFT_724612 [Phaeosphaeriaceae sp. PMI808]|nr:hypothetical protein GQ44DRAFT_724612 [Phaeosphaeriaceae sp. PMI808]
MPDDTTPHNTILPSGVRKVMPRTHRCARTNSTPTAHEHRPAFAFMLKDADAMTNKRGLPSGYLSCIEQRLLDAEIVIFELLSSIYKSEIPIQPVRVAEMDRQVLADISQKQPKSAKIEEWKSLPLITDRDRHGWWQSRCALVSPSVPSSSTGISQDAVTPHDTWLASPSLPSQYYEAQPSLPDILRQSALIVPWQPGLDVIAPAAAGKFDNDKHPAEQRSSIDGTNENAPSVASTESNPLNNPQILSEERWNLCTFVARMLRKMAKHE